jgi:hypothetical protein
LFAEMIVPLADKVPIPLSRLDGAYPSDGSTLFGGVMGGSLDDFLELDGRCNREHLHAAAAGLEPCHFLYDTAPRKKEFELEHIESALEAGADLFVTTDDKSILEPLDRQQQEFDRGHSIRLLHTIAVTPRNALIRLSNSKVCRNVYRKLYPCNAAGSSPRVTPATT